MPHAIFNISNSTLNLAIGLAIFVLVAIWLAMVVYTFLDARRRIEDPFLIGCATVASLFPLVGTAVYAILRPPELLADVQERELDIEAAELRVRHLKAQSCPHCGYPIERNFMRCPSCERRLKDPCTGCDRPVDPRWSICPYCETALPGRRRESRSSGKGKGKSRAKAAASAERVEAARAKEPEAPRRTDGAKVKESTRQKTAAKRPAKVAAEDAKSTVRNPNSGGRASSARRDR